MRTRNLKRLLSLVLCLYMVTGLLPTAVLAAEKSDPAYHATSAVQGRGVLTVAVSGQSRTTYKIPDDPDKYGDLAGTWDGNVPEMCRRIAQELGVEAEFVEYASVEAQLNAVASGEADLAAENFVHTAERLATYEMTDSFLLGEIGGDEVFLSAKPVSGSRIRKEADLKVARIGVVKGTVQVRYTTLQYPKATVVELADNQAVLDAIASGQVQAGVFTMFDKNFAALVVDQIIANKVVQCSYTVKDPTLKGVGLILMKGNWDLCHSINAILCDLRESGWLASCYKTEEKESVERGIINSSDMTHQGLSTKATSCPSSAFPDLDTSKWYHKYVDYVIENGLMGDAGGGLFAPDRTLTRAQVVTVLWQMEGKPQTDYVMDFEDVAEGQWYTETVRWAVSEKIMAGNGDGTFGPNSPITWEQLATILRSYAAYKGYDVSARIDPSAFTGAYKTSAWAYDAMAWACGSMVMTRTSASSGVINPTSTVTRCEFAAAITRFLEDAVL